MEKRKEYHRRYFISTNTPQLRISNAINFSSLYPSSSESGERIRDLHIKLNLGSQGICYEGNNMSVQGGKQYLVDGSYDYYHYMQDNMNDNGWGCAYRSMQTICSWLKLQQYTNKEVPAHKDIQKLLVGKHYAYKSNQKTWEIKIKVF